MVRFDDVVRTERYSAVTLLPAILFHQLSDDQKGLRTFLDLTEVLELCKERRDSIHVGHVGGEEDLERRGVRYPEGKPWKWRDPVVNRGTVVNENWIGGSAFTLLIENLKGPPAKEPR